MPAPKRRKAEVAEQPVEIVETQVEAEQEEVIEQIVEEPIVEVQPEAIVSNLVYLAKGEKTVVAGLVKTESAVYELTFSIVTEKLLHLLNQLDWKFLARPEDSVKYLRTVLGQHCKDVQLLNVQSL